MYPQLLQQPFDQLSTIQLLPLGTVAWDPEDQARTAYRYVLFGGTSTINPALLLVAPAAPTNSTGLALASANSAAQLAAGATQGSLVVTNGATTVVQNQFIDGDLEIIGTNAIERYRIIGNGADAVGNAALQVRFAGALRNSSALVVGTNTVNLRQSIAYQPAASLTQAVPVGVTIMSIPNTAAQQYYGWVQIGGLGLIQATSATKGYPLVQDTGGTAGYVINSAANLMPIGVARESASGSLVGVDLSIR